MPTILSMRDRIKLKIGKITLTLKPLNVLEQTEIAKHKEMKSGVETENVMLTSFAYVKFALKGIAGVKMHDGTDYDLEFDGDYLSDDCVSEIFTLNLGAEFFHAIQRLKNNDVSEKLTYLNNSKKPLKGVSLEIIPNGGIKS